MKKRLAVLLCCLMVMLAPACTPDMEDHGGTSSYPTVDVQGLYDQLHSTQPHTTATTASTKATIALPTTTSTTILLQHTTATPLYTPTTVKKISTTQKPVITEAPEEEIDEPISRTVYITPTGKRYHYRSTCGGKNSYAVTLDQAIAQGFTPCKKCAS